VHSLRTVVLVAHQGCAYYRERLALPPELIEEQQKEDLLRAAQAVGELSSELQVYLFYVRRRKDKIFFEHLPLYGTTNGDGDGGSGGESGPPTGSRL
jgi:hypothetical protein